MKSIRTCSLACVILLAWAPLASAVPHARMLIADKPAPLVVNPVAKRAPIPVAKVRNRRAPRARLRKEDHRKEIQLANATHAAPNQQTPDRASLATAIRNADAHDAVERDARAERLYRSSQLSAPIIPGAKACRRTGAHGESIYENC